MVGRKLGVGCFFLCFFFQTRNVGDGTETSSQIVHKFCGTAGIRALQESHDQWV